MYYHTEITVGVDGMEFLYGLTILFVCLFVLFCFVLFFFAFGFSLLPESATMKRLLLFHSDQLKK